MSSRVCPQCGRSYGDDDRFCTVDGAALVASADGASIIGTVIADRFLVMERLGEGGMGEVYLAEHVRMKRKVALKLMRPWMLGDPVAVGRFHREAENASQISHPNVAQVYDFGETAERVVYLAMEFVDGEPLSAILTREGKVHAVRAAEIVRQIGEALTAAHALGILHRDLKPDNVMVGRTRFGTDLVKLVDFGIARAMNRSTQQFTSTGLVVGTPDYMSPEQLSGDELDGRSDLYALALIAYRLLTGSNAFTDSSSGESLVSRLTGRPRRLEAVRGDVPWPPALQLAFERALAPDPADRFADAMEFVAEIDAAISQLQLSEEEQAYLVALSQRHPTPVRGGAVLDAATPTRGIAGIRIETPATPTATVAPTPPELRQTVEVAPDREVPVTSGAEDDASAKSAPAVVEAATPRERTPRRWIPISLGAVAVAVAAWLLLRPDTPGPAAESRVDLRSTVATADSAMPSEEIAAAPPPYSAPPVAVATADSQLVNEIRRATVAVWSVPRNRTGSAVIVDSSGIALTAASLVAQDSAVDVFVDGNTRIRATVLSIDRTRGIAALLLPMARCQRCGVLSPDATTPAAGDPVVILPARERGDGVAVNTTIATADATTLTTADTPRSVTGAPVVSAKTGQLLSLGAGTRWMPRSVVSDALIAARRSARGRTPSQTVVPIWPERAVPSSQLGAADRIRQQLGAYQVAAKDVGVLVMTPQVLEYRGSWARNPMNVVGDREPIGGWSAWRAYADGRRAVVVLSASHKGASFPDWPQKGVDLRNGDVREVRLYRNDSLVTPIETGRYPALLSNDNKPIPSSAVAVYSAMEFRSGAAFRVEVVEARAPVSLALPVGTLEAIRNDFAWLFR